MFLPPSAFGCHLPRRERLTPRRKRDVVPLPEGDVTFGDRTVGLIPTAQNFPHPALFRQEKWHDTTKAYYPSVLSDISPC